MIIIIIGRVKTTQKWYEPRKTPSPLQKTQQIWELDTMAAPRNLLPESVILSDVPEKISDTSGKRPSLTTSHDLEALGN